MLPYVHRTLPSLACATQRRAVAPGALSSKGLTSIGLAAIALVASVLVLPGCSEPSTPAPASTEATSSAQATPSSPQVPGSPAAKLAPEAAKTDAASKKIADGAQAGRDKQAAQEKAAQAAATDHAGHDHAGHDHAGHDHADHAEAPKVALDSDKGTGGAARTPAAAQAPAAKTATATADDARVQNDKAAMEAKAKAAGLESKVVDPFSQDTDPNSKARLTYEFNTDTKSFGKVMQGDVLDWKFQLQSSGEDDLIIKQAKPTCGCTVANIFVETDGAMEAYQYGKPIPPGRKIELEATLHTQNKRGHTSSKINITTNDPRGQTILGLDADVEPFFQVTPQSVNFGQIGTKDTATDKVQISTTKGDRVVLTAMKDNMPQGLKIDLNPLDPDADGKASRYEMVATAGPGLVEGNLAYSVPLRSDAPIPGGERMPNGLMPAYEVAVTIMARINGAIVFSPAFVSLGLIRPGQTLSRSVRIKSHDAEFKLDPKIAIQGRDTAEWEFAQYFTTVARPVAGENAVDVEVTLNGMPETLAGSFSGMLVITIGHPEKPEIKLPITGVCRGGSTPPVPTPLPVPGGSGNPPR